MQPADPWGFESEPVETWADILAAQGWDLAWLGAFLVLALVSFRRKSVPLKYATLVVAVGYMGFAKSQLVSITNIFSLIDGNLPVVKYNLAFTRWPSSPSCRRSCSGGSTAGGSARSAP